MNEFNEYKEIHGIAVPLPIANLDTDQIMPKQFLRRIDKAGLAEGLLYDLRFDAANQPRTDAVLNHPAYAGAVALIGGPNFGCGSSREHAVWGLQQAGYQVVIAASFGEIFYSNAMNNRLLLVMLPEHDIQTILADVSDSGHNQISVDVATMTIRSRSYCGQFTLAERHRRMFIDGLDVIGSSLLHASEIAAFAAARWEKRPWLKGVAALTRSRLGNTDSTS